MSDDEVAFDNWEEAAEEVLNEPQQAQEPPAEKTDQEQQREQGELKK